MEVSPLVSLRRKRKQTDGYLNSFNVLARLSNSRCRLRQSTHSIFTVATLCNVWKQTKDTSIHPSCRPSMILAASCKSPLPITLGYDFSKAPQQCVERLDIVLQVLTATYKSLWFIPPITSKECVAAAPKHTLVHRLFNTINNLKMLEFRHMARGIQDAFMNICVSSSPLLLERGLTDPSDYAKHQLIGNRSIIIVIFVIAIALIVQFIHNVDEG